MAANSHKVPLIRTYRISGALALHFTDERHSRLLRPDVNNASYLRVLGWECNHAGALNPVGPLLILISAAAASFGGHSGLAWMWTLLKSPRIRSSEFQMPEIERSLAWIIAAIVLAIGFIAGLGPGVKLHLLR